MSGKCAWWSWLALAALATLVAVAGCGGSSGKAAGTEGGPCYGNQSCNTGLTCASNLCVRLTGSGGMGGGSQGSSGQGGSPSTGQGGSSGATGTGGLVGTGGQAGTGAQGGAGGQVPATYAIHFGPIQVAAGVEDTQCVLVRLGNAAPIHVGQIHSQLGAGTVQMILYADTATTEQPTPFDCTPFTSVYSDTANVTALTIVQNADETLTFPSGVGVALGANQMMRIELHYANPSTTAAMTAQATATLSTMPDASFQSAGSLFVISDLDLDLPVAAATVTEGPIFVPVPTALVGSKFFAMTSEEHALGTETQAWNATSAADAGTLVYMNVDWTTPPLTTFASPAPVAAGAGFKYQCTWSNATGNREVKFGLGSSAEICMFVAYYSPSLGPTTCLRLNGTITCCVGASGCN